jgi:hypothetical protein
VVRRPRFGLQYSFAPEHHAARLGDPLTPETATRWRELLRRARWAIPAPVAGETRGDFLRRLQPPGQSRGR